ncbi:hypothetical protein [Nostoc sp. FACHB-110]|nr:hypothetical protein [Nostoc sp. FACHB-110]
MNPKQGDIWLIDLGLSAKTRPVIIVSRYDLPKRSHKAKDCSKLHKIL